MFLRLLTSLFSRSSFLSESFYFRTLHTYASSVHFFNSTYSELHFQLIVSLIVTQSLEFATALAPVDPYFARAADYPQSF